MYILTRHKASRPELSFNPTTHPIIAKHFFGIEPSHPIGPVPVEVIAAGYDALGGDHFPSMSLHEFCDGYAHECQVILVAHPMKMRRREDGTLPVPGLYDISGSANFANKADFGIVVHRDLKTGRTTISVRKCRFKHLGKIGDVELEYDVATGCYSPYRRAGVS